MTSLCDASCLHKLLSQKPVRSCPVQQNEEQLRVSHKIFVVISQVNEEMDLTPNICIACCTIHTKTNLTHVATARDNILSKILTQDCPESLVICLSCNLKLEGFTEFMQKLKNNITLLKLIKSERKREEEKSVSENEDQANTGSLESFAKENPTKIKEVINPPLNLPNVDTVVCDSSTINEELTIKQCDTMDQDPLTQNTEEESIELEIDDTPDAPVSPPPSSESCTFFNNFGLPILVPSSSQESSLAKYIRTSDERRKQRNREASRRYRERARGDPALLQKMREQQNVRQKKYYERCRMKKLIEAESKTSEIVNSNDLFTADDQL